MNRMRKEMEYRRQNQVELLEMKSIMTEMRFSLHRINSKIVLVLQKERPVNLKEQILSDLWDNTKQSSQPILEVLEEEGREQKKI